MRIEKEFKLIISDDVRLYSDNSGHYWVFNPSNDNDKLAKFLLDETFASTIKKIEKLRDAKGED